MMICAGLSLMSALVAGVMISAGCEIDVARLG